METQQEEKVLLSENTEVREKTLTSATKQLEGLTEAYLSFQEQFGLELPLQEVWQHAVESAKADNNYVELFVRYLLYEQNPELKKLPIPKSKAIGLIELPEGYYAYLESLKSLQNFIQRVGYRFEQKTDLEYFTADENGISLNQAFYKMLDAKTRRFASEQEVKVLVECEQIAGRLNELEAQFANLDLLNSIHFRSKRTGKIKVDTSAIRIEEVEESQQEEEVTE